MAALCGKWSFQAALQHNQYGSTVLALRNTKYTTAKLALGAPTLLQIE